MQSRNACACRDCSLFREAWWGQKHLKRNGVEHRRHCRWSNGLCEDERKEGLVPKDAKDDSGAKQMSEGRRTFVSSIFGVRLRDFSHHTPNRQFIDDDLVPEVRRDAAAAAAGGVAGVVSAQRRLD